MLRAICILMPVAAICLAQDPREMLTRLEKAPPAQAASELRRFSAALVAMPPSYWDSRPSQRADFVARTQLYLNMTSRQAALDPGLGLAVSGAYRSLGQMQDSYADRRGAVLSYRNSGLYLTQFANQNPADPSVRGEMIFLGGRVQALVGSIPIWMSVPFGGQQSGRSAPRGIPDSYTQAPAAEEPLAALPTLDRKALSETERTAYEQVADRFQGVSVTVRNASTAAARIRSSVTSNGWNLAASSERSLIHMRLSLEEARQMIEQKQFAPAIEMLAITEGEAKKVLRELGQ